MAISLSNYTANMTEFIMNNNNGATIAVHKGLSDVEVIQALCVDYSNYVILSMVILLVLIFAKAYLHRLMVNNPKNANARRWYWIAANVIDNVVLMFIVINLGVALWGRW